MEVRLQDTNGKPGEHRSCRCYDSPDGAVDPTTIDIVGEESDKKVPGQSEKKNKEAHESRIRKIPECAPGCIGPDWSGDHYSQTKKYCDASVGDIPSVEDLTSGNQVHDSANSGN